MVQTTIRLPEKLYEKLKQEAKKRGMSLNAYLISVLWNAQDYLFATEEDPADRNVQKGGESDGENK